MARRERVCCDYYLRSTVYILFCFAAGNPEEFLSYGVGRERVCDVYLHSTVVDVLFCCFAAGNSEEFLDCRAGRERVCGDSLQHCGGRIVLLFCSWQSLLWRNVSRAVDVDTAQQRSD
jgi:hypothetical protein